MVLGNFMLCCFALYEGKQQSVECESTALAKTQYANCVSLKDKKCKHILKYRRSRRLN